MSEGNQTDAAKRPMPWDILVLLMAYSFMSWFNRTSMQIAGAEQIIPHGGLTPAQMGLVYSAFTLLYALFMIPGGWLIDRVGPRRSLVLMGFGSALFVFLTGVVGDFFASGGLYLFLGMLLVRALMGMCSAPIYPAAASTVVFEMPFQRRAEANGLINGAALIGNAVVPFAFGFFLIDKYGWQNAFRVAGVVTAALAAVWLFRIWRNPLPSPHDAAKSHARSTPPFPWWRLFRNRSIVLIMFAYAAVGYYEYLFFFWTEHYFLEKLKLDKDASRFYTTVLYAAMAVGMFAGGWLSDRIGRSFGLRTGRVWLPLGGILAGVVFLGLGLFASDPKWVAGYFALGLAAVGLCEGPIWTTSVELGGSRGGSAGAIVNAGGNLGGFVAPALTPQLAAWLGWNWAIAAVAPLCLVGCALLAFVDPSERLPEDRAERP